MLPHQTDFAVEGRKTARLEQRTTQQAKELIEQAACLLGVNASDFMVSVAMRAARETLRDYEQTRLTAPAHDAFLRALDATEPSDKLVDLVRLHKEVSARND
ncbi:MAG: DUF1778 domain-containing protein [Devosia sp.]